MYLKKTKKKNRNERPKRTVYMTYYTTNCNFSDINK